MRIAARSVAVALHEPRETSVQNIFRGEVKEISTGPEGLLDVQMDISCPLMARITPRAVRTLALSPGKPIFAIVKRVAVSRGHLNASIQTAIDS